MIEVINPGVLSTIQDFGRYGYRYYGVPISGAMDWYALRVANILVGNPENTAGIEATLCGLKIRACEEVQVAITGGDLSPCTREEPVPLWKPFWLKKNEIVSFPRRKSGFRAYLAVRGGIDVPMIMKSSSTMLKAGFGGTGGKLKPGDILKTGNSLNLKRIKFRPLPKENVPEYKTNIHLSVLAGPQSDCFTTEQIKIFLNSEYEIESQSDRQGYRLNGSEIKHVEGHDLITEAVWPGAIQIAGNGLPIILLADAQVTGGYPKIASVISADLDKLGQAKPSDKIHFKEVSLNKAHHLLSKKEKVIKHIKRLFWD
ncbi:biotin-dependent carboxyltransferase family protein [Thermodesulfobacteriota bacterium]